MSQQLGNEVEMQGRRAALGYDTLQSRLALYQLSYQGNSAGRGSNHNTTQGKPQTTVLYTCGRDSHYFICTSVSLILPFLQFSKAKLTCMVLPFYVQVCCLSRV